MAKKIILIVLAALVAAVVLLSIIIAMQPDDFSVERAETIDAPSSLVFDQVNDLRAWEAWSPWVEMDPDADYTYRGADRGEGAIVEWSGGEESGAGQMTIVESRPNELIRIELQFIEPFESTSTTDFHFTEDGQSTVVTWSMAGENTFMTKAFMLVIDMETLIGDDYERGLARLKEVVETAHQEQDDS